MLRNTGMRRHLDPCNPYLIVLKFQVIRLGRNFEGIERPCLQFARLARFLELDFNDGQWLIARHFRRMAGHRFAELDFSFLQRHPRRLCPFGRDLLRSVREVNHNAVQLMRVRRILDVWLVNCLQNPNLVIVDERLSLSRQKARSEKGQSGTQHSERSCFLHSFSIYRCRNKSRAQSLCFEWLMHWLKAACGLSLTFSAY